MIEYGSAKSAPLDRMTGGPFDSAEWSQVLPMVDFGSIQIPAREDLVLKLEVEEATNRIVALTIELSGSALQLQAFSAPLTEGIWHEIRSAIEASIISSGGKTETVVGPLGPELNAQIPNRDGGSRLAKFVGVDGPRWFLRGVISGNALAEPLAMANMIDLFRSVIVVRGSSPMPPKDLLPLVAPAGAKKTTA